jgi:hypothetical protein
MCFPGSSLIKKVCCLNRLADTGEMANGNSSVAPAVLLTCCPPVLKQLAATWQQLSTNTAWRTRDDECQVSSTSLIRGYISSHTSACPEALCCRCTLNARLAFPNRLYTFWCSVWVCPYLIWIRPFFLGGDRFTLCYVKPTNRKRTIPQTPQRSVW